MIARTLITAILKGEESLAKNSIQGKHGGISEYQTMKIMIDKALFICCSRGYLELSRLLLDKGANVATRDKNLATPLHGAADNGYVELVRLLIHHGADVNAQTCRGDTPLHLASYRGHGKITRCLMEAGADCRLVNIKFFTAENEAVVQGHTDVVSLLRTKKKGENPPVKKQITQFATGTRKQGFF
ncbi:unnamed protein product [Candidula unifasciata]|uniref:Uncharacterized protein n=1 Tax=Candidula unifasciata TaxID=100452 RepID=A0A8S3ZWB8_9EUPU|nr:unnamed protein product [Candidula unifasciata]